MNVGVRPAVPKFEGPAAMLRDYVGAVEDAGLDLLCVGDHVSFRNGQGYDGLIQATPVGMAPSVNVGVTILRQAFLGSTL